MSKARQLAAIDRIKAALPNIQTGGDGLSAVTLAAGNGQINVTNPTGQSRTVWRQLVSTADPNEWRSSTGTIPFSIMGLTNDAQYRIHDGVAPQLVTPLLPAPVGDAYDTAVLADNPILYWRDINGTEWTDKSGNGLHGTILNAGTPVTGPGSVLTQHAVLGTTAHASAAHNSLLNFTGSFTFEVWALRIGSQASFVPMIGKGGDTAIRVSAAGNMVARVAPGRETATEGGFYREEWCCYWMRFDISTGVVDFMRRRSGVALENGLSASVGTTAAPHHTNRFNINARDNAGSWDRFGNGRYAAPAVYPVALTTARMNAHFDAAGVA